MTRGATLIALVFVVTIGSGLIQGKLSNRWGHPADRNEAAARLKEFPSTDIGNWKLVQEADLTDRVREILDAAGWIKRTYRNDTGDIVHVAVLIGPPQPIALHTPEICYNSRDQRIKSKRVKEKFPGEEGGIDEFWKTEFEAKDFSSESFFVYYGWTTGENWKAEGNTARFKYVWQPYLYKLQVASTPKPSAMAIPGAAAEDPAKEFIKQFLPEIRKYLQPQG